VDLRATAVAAAGGSDENGNRLLPAWPPRDGSQIAFVTDEGGPLPHYHLVVNVDGTGDPREIDELTHVRWAGVWYFCACYG
jgi:hypothetical protein